MTVKTNKIDVDEVQDLAWRIHAQGYHCSETVMRAVGSYVLDESDLNDTLLKMVSTLHGGLADTKNGPCGALVAGIMIIGALYGRFDIAEDCDRACAIAQRWCRAFKREFGTEHCGTLKQGDPGPEYPTVCGTIMVRAARMLAELLNEVAVSEERIETPRLHLSGRDDTSKLTSRERIQLTLDHHEPDRVPYDLGTSGATGIHVEALRKVLPYLGFDKKEAWLGNVFGQLAALDEDLRQRLGVDTQAVPRNPGAALPQPERDGDYFTLRDKWGAVWVMPVDGGQQFSPYHAPLADLSDASELESYPWPDVAPPDRVEAMAAEAKRLFEETDRALMVGPCCLGLFQMGWLLRGLENFAMDLALNPLLVETLLERVLELKMAYWGALLPKLNGNVLIIRENDDYGSQHGLQISPQTFRRYMKRRWKRLFDFVREKASGKIYIYFHSCGAIRRLIPDFIELGVQILNPVQVSAEGMDTCELKAEFGADLTFWGGGVDTQHVLPSGTPQEVREEVRRRIADLASGGGFVFTPVHNIQADVPPENLIAMWEALEEFGRY
jgi:uroporphyrinogen decarboxylase